PPAAVARSRRLARALSPRSGRGPRVLRAVRGRTGGALRGRSRGGHRQARARVHLRRDRAPRRQAQSRRRPDVRHPRAGSRGASDVDAIRIKRTTVPEPSSLLQTLAEAVADGSVVDWDEAESSAATDEERSAVAHS